MDGWLNVEERLLEREFLEETIQSHHEGKDLDALQHSVFNIFVLHGETRLSYAAERNWCKAVRWLLRHGADVHVGRPQILETPLIRAAKRRRREAALLLLKAGARVGDRTAVGLTALHLAASRNDAKMCALLMTYGAAPETRSSEGETAGGIARRYASADAAALLAAVAAAGGWVAYAFAPRAELLALRRDLPRLRGRGRAAPSTDRTYQRLFLDPRVPDDVFTHVLAYWRSARDYGVD